MGRKRFKKTHTLHTLLQLRVLWGMGGNINHDAVCVFTDWDGYCEGKRTLSNESVEQKNWNQAAVSEGIPSDAASSKV